MSNIRFTCPELFSGIIPEPARATKFIPEYFKKIPPTLGTEIPTEDGTIKRCIPFLEALTQGFIIPLWADLIVVAKDGDLNMYSGNDGSGHWQLGTHLAGQLANHPRWDMPYGKLIWKFINPWGIETDKNYSCMFTSPLNHLETRFKVLDGVVDSDTYKANVNFPFMWTGGDGEFTIKKGTPLMQVIPFKREVYKCSIGVTDGRAAEKIRVSLTTLAHDSYKRLFWHKRKEDPDS